MSHGTSEPERTTTRAERDDNRSRESVVTPPSSLGASTSVCAPGRIPPAGRPAGERRRRRRIDGRDREHGPRPAVRRLRSQPDPARRLGLLASARARDDAGTLLRGACRPPEPRREHGAQLCRESLSTHAVYRREAPRPEPDRRMMDVCEPMKWVGWENFWSGRRAPGARIFVQAGPRGWRARLRSRAGLSHLGRPLAAPQSRRRACARQCATCTALVARRGSDPFACRSFVTARFGSSTQGSLAPRGR